MVRPKRRTINGRQRRSDAGGPGYRGDGICGGFRDENCLKNTDPAQRRHTKALKAQEKPITTHKRNNVLRFYHAYTYISMSLSMPTNAQVTVGLRRITVPVVAGDRRVRIFRRVLSTLCLSVFFSRPQRLSLFFRQTNLHYAFLYFFLEFYSIYFLTRLVLFLWCIKKVFHFVFLFFLYSLHTLNSDDP